jgi:UDP:flavonoid glycosyltransferase YjiC (YdhE family)
MSRYLMVLWSGGGCVPPQLAFAKRLLRAGHEVSILAPRSPTERVRASGATFEAIPTRTGARRGRSRAGPAAHVDRPLFPVISRVIQLS